MSDTPTKLRKQRRGEDGFFYLQEVFGVEKNHLSDSASWDGHMFETYGKEVEYIRSLPDNRVVTIFDPERGNPTGGFGMHFVNRLGFLVLTRPAPEEFRTRIIRSI